MLVSRVWICFFFHLFRKVWSSRAIRTTKASNAPVSPWKAKPEHWTRGKLTYTQWKTKAPQKKTRARRLKFLEEFTYCEMCAAERKEMEKTVAAFLRRGSVMAKTSSHCLVGIDYLSFGIWQSLSLFNFIVCLCFFFFLRPHRRLHVFA